MLATPRGDALGRMGLYFFMEIPAFGHPVPVEEYIIRAPKFAPYYIIGISPFLTDCKNTEI